MYPLFRAREKMVFLLSVLGFMAPFGAPSLTAQTPRFDELTPGLVSIETHRNTKPDDWNDQFQWEAEELGTGFIVADHDGLVRVLTAEHVVQGASEVTVSLSSDKGIKATARVMSAGAKIDHEAPRDRGFVAV